MPFSRVPNPLPSRLAAPPHLVITAARRANRRLAHGGDQTPSTPTGAAGAGAPSPGNPGSAALPGINEEGPFSPQRGGDDVGGGADEAGEEELLHEEDFYFAELAAHT